MIANKPTGCAACGDSIVQSTKGVKEFCSDTCKRAGRAFCKGCEAPLTQLTVARGARKTFCSDLCRARYHRIGRVGVTYLDERNRTECLGCGKPITQPKTVIKRFCSGACSGRYHRTGGSEKKALVEDWGTYGPETRKVLREVQQLISIGAAKRVATAIDREYIRRNKQPRFRFRSSPTAKLTWEQVDEIRALHVAHWKAVQIADKFGLSQSSLYRIINYESYKPENDPRRNVRGRGEPC